MKNKKISLTYPQQAGSDLPWRDLSGAQLSLAIAQASQEYPGHILVVCQNPQAAQQYLAELSFFSDEQTEIQFFNDWETLPYDHFSPHQDIISERLKILQQLPSRTNGITLISASSLLQHLPPAEHIEAHSLLLSTGDNLDLDKLRSRFVRCGYNQVEQVMQHGEFAVRGSIIDIFPMGSHTAYRIDLFDEQIDSIRTFNPETQRSIDKVENITLLPAREFPLNEAGITLFRQNWRAQFSGNPAQSQIYQDISQGIASNGIEYYLPLFYEKTASLLDYLPINNLIIKVTDIEQQLDNFWQEIDERYQQLRYDTSRPLLAPEAAFITPEQCLKQLSTFKNIQNHFAAYAHQTLTNLDDYVASISKPILFTAESLGHREKLQQQLSTSNIHCKVADTWQAYQAESPYTISVAKLATGCETDDFVIISESQITGQAPQIKSSKTSYQDPATIIRNLTDLTVGEPVVHIDHGVGRYLGLQIINEAEFVTLEYADNNKLYVPVTNLHLINRYGGMDNEHVPLNKLGNDQWSKTREKAAKRAHDVAAELLAINAKRYSKVGFKFNPPDKDYLTFANNFPFELTQDQEKAIENIIADMISDNAMDRLVCGDVGFGKTEVAMRAAFLAVQSGTQAAVLVPTTLLAQQHYETFQNRFADSGVTIEVLSRFNTAKKQQQILDDLTTGKIDIVIGTHKLIQKDIKFKNLRLMIIDEEHRFGVRQKEQLKKLRADIDILTLTATPIPRTLNMALSDIRSLSIIGTPPAKRLAIKTFVHEYGSSIVREALLREIMRGGQVFYLHNNVKTIAQRTRELQELLPEAKVSFAHGQMRETELEKIMADFYHQRFNVLVATTIIENGIDIPTANTIIIERADKLGLAQLHQLRGRVGRSHHQAYAYLLTPAKSLLTKDAEKRLDAISQLEALGIGFTLATHDLEIRGAGEFLGDEQSGHIQNIGFGLYMELLDRAVASIKEGTQFDYQQPVANITEVDLGIATLLPESYVPDVHTRLVLYKRIANATSIEQLDELQIEMIDRFGLLPDAAKNLFATTEIKLLAAKLAIDKITATKQFIYFDFGKNTPIDPMTIINLIQKQPQLYKMEGAERLRCKIDSDTIIQQVSKILAILNN